MTFIETLKGFDIFLNALKKITGYSQEADQHQKELIKELGSAARETEVAIKKLREGKDTRSDLEISISKKWVAAAALLKNDDKELALRLYQKGQAWTTAASWTPENFEVAIANIKEIDEYVEKILRA